MDLDNGGKKNYLRREKIELAVVIGNIQNIQNVFIYKLSIEGSKYFETGKRAHMRERKRKKNYIFKKRKHSTGTRHPEHLELGSQGSGFRKVQTFLYNARNSDDERVTEKGGGCEVSSRRQMFRLLTPLVPAFTRCRTNC